MPNPDILRARGLSDDPQPTPQVAPFVIDSTGAIVAADTGETGMQFSADLPDDYGARIEALRLATGAFRHLAQEEVMEAAHAFLAFLTNTETPEQKPTSRTFTDE